MNGVFHERIVFKEIEVENLCLVSVIRTLIEDGGEFSNRWQVRSCSFEPRAENSVNLFRAVAGTTLVVALSLPFLLNDCPIAMARVEPSEAMTIELIECS